MNSSKLFVLILITATTSALSIWDPKACQVDSDCDQWNNPNSTQGPMITCWDNVCSCPIGAILAKTSDKELKFECVNALKDTEKSCTDNSNCRDFQKCLRGTCQYCMLGSLSIINANGSATCVAHLYEGVCRSRYYKVEIECKEEFQICKGNEYHDFRRCQCLDGYNFDNNSRKCIKMSKLGESCTTAKLCLDDPDTYGYLRCSNSTNGTCVCTGLYDEEKKFCFQRAAKSCPSHSHCPPGARCIGDECNCRDEKAIAVNGGCLPVKFDLRCDEEYEMSEENKRGLKLQGLTCINDRYRCEYPTEQYYDGQLPGYSYSWWKTGSHMCRIFVGSHCTSVDDNRCTDGASCVAQSNVLAVALNGTRGSEFRCQCNSGHSSTSDNKCMAHVPFGAQCIDNCNNYAGVICKNKTCQCPDENIKFDPILQRCLSPENHFCGTLDLKNKVHVECQNGLSCSRGKGVKMYGLKCIKSIDTRMDIIESQ